MTILKLILCGYIAVGASFFFLGVYLTEKRDRTRQRNWYYQGLYENLIKAAESEARKLDV